jgi:hypothetical protein
MVGDRRTSANSACRKEGFARRNVLSGEATGLAKVDTDYIGMIRRSAWPGGQR